MSCIVGSKKTGIYVVKFLIALRVNTKGNTAKYM